ncbi:MAG: MltA domain-containing protein [Rhodospirillaceae bacterium]|nr:MltA domain-containing protein [Rhodospirillaceae bacterium]
MLPARRRRKGPAAGRLLAAALTLGLAACQANREEAVAPSATPEVAPAALAANPVAPAFRGLAGWEADDHAAALATFLNSCPWFADQPASLALDYPDSSTGTVADWRRVCADAQRLPAGDGPAARRFFEQRFRPIAMEHADGSRDGLFTGYYAPRLRGDWQPSATYATPLYSLPDWAPGERRPTRADIAQGALAGRNLELIWVDDPVDAFFLEIQGSGLVDMADGELIGVRYIGQNGHGYVPVGRVLIDWGEATADDMSMEVIRAWLAANPDRAQALMNENPSYVFFERRGPDAIVGNLDVPLTAERSLAVDWGHVPRGAPVWLDIADDPTVPGGSLRRLMVAQDTGGAIRGAVAGDVFWGFGDDAAAHASGMRARGQLTVLVPAAAAAER